jgi:7-cyano-7-deazaguanine reductase
MLVFLEFFLNANNRPFGDTVSTRPSTEFEVFPNPKPSRDYTIRIESPEFTCLCPKTGQPDFATLLLEYIPDQRCVELKSWKLYLWSFRDQGGFHEDLSNRIVDDLVTALDPRYLRLTAKFNVRGGVYTTVEVEHKAEGWAKS